MLPPTLVRLEKFPTHLRLTRGRSGMQRSGAVIHEDDPGEVTMVLRVPPGSGVTFAGGETEISTSRHVDTGDHETLLVDWRLVAEPGMRPAFVILEVDLLSEDEGPNTGTVGIQLSYVPVSLGMLLAGIVAAIIGAVLMTKRRKRDGETLRESAASQSGPRTDAPGSSAGRESGPDRSRPTFR
jgi:hypothetical protein